MPGIVAIINKFPDEALLKSMLSSITHKEWQKMEFYVKPPLAVGRVHLGITNAEPQPIFNEDETAFVMMYGELYDYESEKKRLELNGHKFKIGNSAEFSLHLYEECGERFVQKLNGMFVLVICDIKNQRILIANDRHALLPIYYTKNRNGYIFASEIKAILKDENFKKIIDHRAVADFFAFGKILGDKTFFRGIKALPPASLVVWSNGKVFKKKYWDFSFKEEENPLFNEDYYVNRLAAFFRKSVERRTRDKLRYGVFLSGGLDSRLTVSAIDKNVYPICTFTYGVKGGDEAAIANKVANELGTKHTFMELKEDYLVSFAEEGVYLTDGMLNCAHFFWISFLPMVRNYADVMFHGLGLDVLLSTVLSHTMFAHFFATGAVPFLERQISNATDSLFPNLLYRYHNSLISEELMPFFFSDAYYQKIRQYPHQSFQKHLEMVKERDPVNRMDSFWLRFFGRYYLSRVILRNYVEDRMPSLDNDFFDLVLTIPRKLRFNRQRLYFKVLAKINPRLAKIPYQRTGVSPVMPIILHRIGFLIKGAYKFIVKQLRIKTHGFVSLPEKLGYPDYNELIRRNKNLREYFEKILLDRKTLERGYFNPDFIVQMVNDHMSCKKNWGMALCALLTFELWHRLFVDEPKN